MTYLPSAASFTLSTISLNSDNSVPAAHVAIVNSFEGFGSPHDTKIKAVKITTKSPIVFFIAFTILFVCNFTINFVTIFYLFFSKMSTLSRIKETKQQKKDVAILFFIVYLIN